MDLQAIVQQLQKPLDDYKSVPFWSWNTKLEKDRLCEQIDDMKAWEMGGYFMHAREGLKTEYLSDEWMRCVEACVEHGKAVGMDSWLYDENGYPSGFAGGKLLENEADRDKYILHTVGAFDAEATVSYRMDAQRLVRVSSAEDGAEYLNLYIRTSVDTADILNPDVVRRFLELTHEKYKAYFGGDLRGKLRGVFTDEPQYCRGHLPYTEQMAVYYREQFDEDILDGLGLLVVEKEGYRAFRYRYWYGMQKLMLESFAQQVYGWCEQNGMELTGHYVEEATVAWQLMCGGGVMPFYEFEHIPGIDWLARDTNNELSQRQVVSVAAQTGKKRILTESFGCCGWQVTPLELKRIVDFQFVAGVNLLCQHLFPVEECGQRKRDHPAHFSAFNPWVPAEFAAFNRYVKRLSYLIAESTEPVNVAMLHPLRSAYFDYQRYAPDNGIGALDRHLQESCRMLSAAGVNYHFLDETVLARHGFVEGDRIGCGCCAYDYLVLPHIVTMDASTEALLRQYVQGGGKVLMLGDVPSYIEATPADYGWLQSNVTFEELLAAQPCRMLDRDTELYQTYRVLGDTPFAFIQNASKSETYTQTLQLAENVRSFVRLDLLTLQTDAVGMTVTLRPGESAVLFPCDRPAPEQKELPTVTLPKAPATLSFEQNSFIVDYVSYSTDGVQYSAPMPCIGMFQKLLEHRYEGDIWFKFTADIRHRPHKLVLCAEKCAAPEYRFNGQPITFTGHLPSEPQFLTADVTALAQEGVNEFTYKLHWHENEDVYFALFGENVTESLRNKIVYDSEIEPVYLYGDFGVYTATGYTDAGEGYVYGDHFYLDVAPTAVTEPVTEGLPFFAGKLTLTQTVTLADPAVQLQVDGNWPVAYVRVNGHDAGKLLFTNRVDISPYAVAGDNQIEVTYIVSNRNLLGPHHPVSGARGYISPSLFELRGTWKDGYSEAYVDRYELLTLRG